jgi:cytoskeleton protein RodZ
VRAEKANVSASDTVNAEDPVSPVRSVGQELRKERERQGKQLDDVWRALKISKTFLAAIEEGRFEEFPSRVSTLAYVGRYERYLQLDIENLLERLQAEIGYQDSVVNHRVHIESPSDVEPSSNRKVPVVGIAIAIAGLVLALLTYSGNGIASFVTRTFEQGTEEGRAQQLASALVVPPRIEQKTQREASESTAHLPFEVETTHLVSRRPELSPPIPQIAVTGLVSLRADLAAADIRQGLPPGRRYGLQNLNSRITLRVHRPTIVAIRDARNRIFIDRKLVLGDTYRVPNLAGLWLTAIDAGAVEIVLDGASIGFIGAQNAAVRDLSLNPQSIANRRRSTS